MDRFVQVKESAVEPAAAAEGDARAGKALRRECTHDRGDAGPICSLNENSTCTILVVHAMTIGLFYAMYIIYFDGKS